jgi:holliday junction DNA helicase RuvA
VLELKDKVGGPATGAFTVNGDGGTGSGSSPLGEVRDALLGLGYSAGEVQQALAAVVADGGIGAPTSELLRRCLRHLGAAAFDGARA